MLAIAYLIGYEMQETLSFFAMIPLSLSCYYYWNRYIEREPHWFEYVVLFVGLYIFDKAQYKVDGERIMYLAASALVIFVICCWIRLARILLRIFASIFIKDIGHTTSA